LEIRFPRQIRFLLIILALHYFKVLYWFQKIDLDSSLPILNHDYVMYFARALRFCEFMKGSHRFWGYDPFQMAGYLCGPVHEVGNHSLSLICYFLSSFFPVEKTLLLAAILGFVFIPLTIYFSVRNFGGSVENGVFSIGITTLMFGLFERTTSDLVFKGVFGFIMGSFLGVYQVSLLWRAVHEKKPMIWVWFGLISGVVIMIHSAVSVVVLIPNILIYVLYFQELKPRDHLFFLLATVLAFAINWYWIRPFIVFRDWLVPVKNFFPLGLDGVLFRLSPFHSDLFGFLKWIFSAVLLLLAGKTVVQFFEDDKRKGIIFLIWLFALGIIFINGGIFIHFDFIQPARFIVPFWFIVYVLASFQINSQFFNFHWGRSVIVFLLILFFQGVLSSDENLFFNKFGWEQQELIEFVKKSEFSGRFLLECDESNLPNYGDFIPVLTKKSFLGGSNPGNFLKTRFTNFVGSYYTKQGLETKPILFNRSLEKFDERTLFTHLDLYNVSYIASRNPDSVKLLEAFPDRINPVVKMGSTQIFKVECYSGWFVRGQGDILFDYDRIHLNKVSGKELVLKFHWLPGFKSSPPLEIKPVYLLDDPVPFIRVLNPSNFRVIDLFFTDGGGA